MRAFLTIVLALTAAALLPGCGYSLAGRGSFLPASIKTIGIPNFTNATPFYQIDQAVTEKVRSEFIGRGKYKVLPQAEGVDGLLVGEITSLGVAPADFNDQRQATRYVITVTARIEFRDVHADKVLWQNAGLVFREDYEVTSGAVSVTDPSAFFGQQANALDRVATDFARTVVSAILEAF